jgi:hypothetical protein
MKFSNNRWRLQVSAAVLLAIIALISKIIEHFL